VDPDPDRRSLSDSPLRTFKLVRLSDRPDKIPDNPRT
jgi:hypothetical protein